MSETYTLDSPKNNNEDVELLLSRISNIIESAKDVRVGEIAPQRIGRRGLPSNEPPQTMEVRFMSSSAGVICDLIGYFTESVLKKDRFLPEEWMTLSVKVNLALLQDYLKSYKPPQLGDSLQNSLTSEIQHGLSKNGLYYDGTPSKGGLLEEAIILAAHAYESKNYNSVSYAMGLYKKLEGEEFEQRIKELSENSGGYIYNDYNEGIEELFDSPQEKLAKEMRLYEETTSLIEKHKDEITFEAVIKEMERIKEKLDGLLEND